MNLAKTTFAVFGIILTLSSCLLHQKSEREIMSETYSSAMNYDLLYGIIGGDMDYCRGGQLTLSSLTVENSFHQDSWQYAKNNFPQLEQQTWENFLQVNSRQIPFPSDLDFDCEYTLLEVEQNPPDWSRESFACIYYFSQIGFNSRKNQALVYRGVDCNDFAYGSYFFAEIIDGTWTVTDMADVFVT